MYRKQAQDHQAGEEMVGITTLTIRVTGIENRHNAETWSSLSHSRNGLMRSHNALEKMITNHDFLTPFQCIIAASSCQSG